MVLKFADVVGMAPKKVNYANKSSGIPGLDYLRYGINAGAKTQAPTAIRKVPVAPKAPAATLNSNWSGGVAAPAPAPAPSYNQGYNDAAAKAASAAAAATSKANAEGKAASKKQNDSTRAMAEQQRKLIDSFGAQRNTKLSNIQSSLDRSTALLEKNYKSTLTALDTNRTNNEAAESDSSFKNVTNAIRERGELANQAASQGAGETDLIKTQLQALRNYSSNQSDVNRSFYDTLASINSSVTALNADTATSKTNLFNQAESDKESAWANFYNQSADTWTQIGNLENSNTNTDTDSSEAYKKLYANAGDKAAEAAKGSYKKQGTPNRWTEWAGKGKTKDTTLSSSRAATVNLSGPMKSAEGATLRKW